MSAVHASLAASIEVKIDSHGKRRVPTSVVGHVIQHHNRALGHGDNPCLSACCFCAAACAWLWMVGCGASKSGTG
jgi:hypothetical protein